MGAVLIHDMMRAHQQGTPWILNLLVPCFIYALGGLLMSLSCRTRGPGG